MYITWFLTNISSNETTVNSIQARPMKGKPWEYLFFVDMQGHAEDESVSKALRESSAVAHSHKVLGSYPRSTLTRSGGRG